MDLVILVLVLCLIGFAVHLLTTKIPMPPYWSTVILIFAVLAIGLYLLNRFGAVLPNILP